MQAFYSFCLPPWEKGVSLCICIQNENLVVLCLKPVCPREPYLPQLPFTSYEIQRLRKILQITVNYLLIAKKPILVYRSVVNRKENY